MSKFTFALVTTLAASVTGCASSAGTASSPSVTSARPVASITGCGPTPKVKILSVTVAENSASIVISSRTILIGKSRAGVKWVIEPPGYQFAPYAVTFKPDQPVGPLAPSPTGDTAEYLWCFDTSARGSWEYTIALQATGTPDLVWYCDPTIVNHADFSLVQPKVEAVGTVQCSANPPSVRAPKPVP